MFKMFAQMFAAIQVLFAAAEKGATAVNYLGDWAQETAGAFADEARVLRSAKMTALLAEHGIAEVPVITLKAPTSLVKPPKA